MEKKIHACKQEIATTIECKCNSSDIIEMQWDMLVSINGKTILGHY
jgi:hypothetical protein